MNVETALVEWYQARKAFCAMPGVAQTERFPREIWNRLADAEERLRELAENVVKGLYVKER